MSGDRTGFYRICFKLFELIGRKGLFRNTCDSITEAQEDIDITLHQHTVNTLNCVSRNKIVRKRDQPARMSESVQIKIKSPSANYSDLELPFQLTETVLTAF